MKHFWIAVLEFFAASAFGAVFCNVLLTLYEQRKGDILDNQDGEQVRALKTQRLIFRWSLGAGIIIGLLTLVLRLLPPNI